MLPKMENSISKQEAKLVSNIMKQAIERGLEVQVVLTAVRAMKREPTYTIVEVMYEAFDEWLK